MPTGALHGGPVRLHDRIVYRNPFIVVFDDPVRFPDGRVGSHLRIQDSAGYGGVAAVPWRAGMIGLVRQFRYPVGEPLWEIPRGSAESPDPATEVRRELREEIGADPTELVALGVLHPDSGLLTTQVSLYLARLPEALPLRLGPEVEAMTWMPVPEVLARIADGALTDAITVAAVSRAHLRGLL